MYRSTFLRFLLSLLALAGFTRVLPYKKYRIAFHGAVMFILLQSTQHGQKNTPDIIYLDACPGL